MIARKVVVLLVVVVALSVPALAQEAPAVAATSADMGPWVKLTTVGGAVHEGQLVKLRFSDYYGSNGQCPGLAWDIARLSEQKLTVRVGAERTPIDMLRIKRMSIQWAKSDFGDFFEPRFTLSDDSGERTGLASWLPSTSVSEAVLTVNGKANLITANPADKLQQPNLIAAVEFGVLAPPDCPEQVSILQRKNDDLSKENDRLRAENGACKLALDEYRKTSGGSGDLVKRQANYIKLLEEKLSKCKQGLSAR